MWVRRALNGPFRRFPTGVVVMPESLPFAVPPTGRGRVVADIFGADDDDTFAAFVQDCDF